MPEIFKNRLIRLLEKQGWRVEKQPHDAIVDIIATRSGGDQRAFIVKPHGHISRAKMTALHNYTEYTGIRIVHVHESGEHEMVFSRLYKRLRNAKTLNAQKT